MIFGRAICWLLRRHKWGKAKDLASDARVKTCLRCPAVKEVKRRSKLKEAAQ